MSKLRARQVHAGDFHQFDLILAMDASNMRDLRAIRPGDATAELHRFLDYLPDQSLRDVPDPYFTQGFEAVLDIAERAGRALIHDLQGSRQNSDDTRRGAPPAPTDAV